MGDLKYTNLVIRDLDDLIDGLLEEARKTRGLSVDQMAKALAGGKIFEMIEETFPDHIINQYDKSYLDNWLNIFGRNQQKIVAEHADIGRVGESKQMGQYNNQILFR